MILEGIVTTRNSKGETNVAPMGPIVEPDMSSFLFRPFETSTTCQNLLANKQGVFHVIDDVLLLAKTAVGRLSENPETKAAEIVEGDVLLIACRWYEFRITSINDQQMRHEMKAEVVHAGRLRDFFGFNRAKHAVLEAAILATRLHLLPKEEIDSQIQAMEIIIEKTAGADEQEAFELVKNHIENYEQKIES